jgi:predicted anti-sigma-YlaC factor YlaD
MLTPFPASDCAQAREAASARLDDELSEIGAVRLDLHLGACSECRRYAHEIGSLAAELRNAALVRPQSTVVLPRRRHVPMSVTAAAAAAVVALLTVSSLTLERAFNGQGSPAKTLRESTISTGIHASANEEHLLAQLRGFEQVPVGQLGRVTVI